MDFGGLYGLYGLNLVGLRRVLVLLVWLRLAFLVCWSWILVVAFGFW